MRGLVNKLVSRSLSVSGEWQQQQPRRLNIHEYQLVVKSKILAGGRGLGTFKSGLKGGAHIVKRDQPEDIADCKTFMEKFNEIAESQQVGKESADGDEAAGLIDNLSVKKKKSEEKSKEAEEGEPAKEEKETKKEKEEEEKKTEVST